MIPWCLYELQFPNGKSYLGISSDCTMRWRQHDWHAENGSKFAVHCAIRKYGATNVSRRILAIGSEKYIQDLECSAIKSFNSLVPSGYNISLGGETAPSKSESARYKIRASKLEMWSDPSYRERMIEFIAPTKFVKGMTPWNKGGTFSAETREKMAKAKRGKKQPDAVVEKRTAATKVSWENPERRNKFSESVAGRKWITDGVTKRLLPRGESVPKGWRFGYAHSEIAREVRARSLRCPERRAKHSATMTGRRWINNGIQQKLARVDGGIPEGWVLGILKHAPVS